VQPRSEIALEHCSLTYIFETSSHRYTVILELIIIRPSSGTKIGYMSDRISKGSRNLAIPGLQDKELGERRSEFDVDKNVKRSEMESEKN
jgi:hypothetical protein